MTEPNRPAPGPRATPSPFRPPTGPAPRPGVLPAPAETLTAHRRRERTRSRLVRRTRRFVNSRRGVWVLASVAAVVVLMIGLLASGFLSSPAPDRSGDGPVAGGDGLALDSAAPTPGASGSSSTAATSKKGPASSQDIQNALKAKIAENPLNNLRGPGYHDLTIAATSRDTISVVGYLVPTGTRVYGAPKPNSRSFSLSQKAYGKGYLAAVFVQAGPRGAAITCSVTVDGQTTNTESTQGPYGRAVCLG